jgi:hypothetical protein
MRGATNFTTFDSSSFSVSGFLHCSIFFIIFCIDIFIFSGYLKIVLRQLNGEDDEFEEGVDESYLSSCFTRARLMAYQSFARGTPYGQQFYDQCFTKSSAKGKSKGATVKCFGNKKFLDDGDVGKFDAWDSDNDDDDDHGDAGSVVVQQLVDEDDDDDDEDKSKAAKKRGSTIGSKAQKIDPKKDDDDAGPSKRPRRQAAVKVGKY